MTRYKLRSNKKNLPIITRQSALVPHSGFTLLELIVVIFIVSLLLAVSLPSFTGIGESRIKSDAKKLASIIRYLNDTAISTKEEIRMKINFSEKTVSYKIYEGEKAERFDSISGIELQSRGMVSEGEVVIFFMSSGSSESFEIYLNDEKNAQAVMFNSLSGRVKIVQDQNEKRKMRNMDPRNF